MKNEIEQQIFEKMKVKDFGESMCNETKQNVLRWVMQQLRKHDVSGELNCEHDWFVDMYDHFGFPASRICDKCNTREAI